MTPPRQHAPRRTRRSRYRSTTRARRAPIGAGVRRELVRNRLIESRLTPNAISLTGLALNVVAAVLVWERLFFLGGIAFIVGSVMDTLDGRYSRMSGKGTPFGAFLDSTLDRLEEGLVLTAVGAYFADVGHELAVAATVFAVLCSLMVSHTRARAEALRVAVVGVGNCASSFVQGVEFYRDADARESVPGLMHVDVGGDQVGDIEFSAAFDIDADKVGKDLSGAIWAGQNNTLKFAGVPELGIPVHRGMTHDGLG